MVRANSWKRVCVLCLLCAGAAISASAQTFTSLASFTASDGNFFGAALVQGFDGSFYSLAGYGGTCPAGGWGTLYRVTPEGSVTVPYNFCSGAQYPGNDLVLFTDGRLYTTTVQGGPLRVGSIDRITSQGKLAQLHAFDSNDGAYPVSGLVLGTDSNFYGITGGGGANQSGTFFRITPGLKLTMFNIPSISGGWEPYTLMQGTGGNFYGTSLFGSFTYGSVFKITPGGVLTLLHIFNGTDGFDPFGTLIQASDGNFYGTTHVGGTHDDGTVFRITADGVFTIVHSFDGTEGNLPVAGLVQATDGNLYGTTSFGGPGDGGTIFQITPGGVLTTLHYFCSQTNCIDGGSPLGTLLQATDGDFYGTTNSGGASQNGTVFRFSMGLGPFVTTVPTARGRGRGMSVVILGTNLTGATSVTFNGKAATFTVVSPTEITTTVPQGATTGTVQVVTPGGTLSSNVPFRVF